MRPNKLKCLYLAITFQYSITFAGNTRSLAKKEASERCSNWVGSGLTLKDKRSSLLSLIVCDEGKGFYNIDAWSTMACLKESEVPVTIIFLQLSVKPNRVDHVIV